MLKPRYTPLALIVGSLLSTSSFAEDNTITDQNSDDIVISASRVATKRVETGSSITVLDEAYLKENQSRTVAEVLQDVPGVNVTNTGGLGSTTSVFIRGAASNETLVIIDGIEVNDLSSITSGYDFAHLMTDNIERIEVLKGSQSALWGSDAMGGVINIITKRGNTTKFTPTLSLEVGENNYKKGNASFSGGINKSHYLLSVSSLATDGTSAKETDIDNNDKDGYKNTGINLKLDHQFTNIFSMDTVLRYSNSDRDYDGYSTDENSSNTQHQAKLNTYINLLDNQWKNRFSVAFSDSENKVFSGDTTKSTYEGQKIKTDIQSDYYFKKIDQYSQRISFIAEHENNKYQSWAMDEKQRIESSGLALNYGIDWQKSVFINTAVRHDFNDTFDDTTTYHLDISTWVSDGTRLHSSYGTGVKNPTLGQLYGYSSSSYGDYNGNPDLTPEKSYTWDIGIEYNFSNADAYVDLTYFDSRYTDMITYQSNTYYNIDNATARGLEFTGNLKITTDFRLNAGYTYMETDNGSGDELARRPKHSASINANYKYTPKLSANIGTRYVGERLNSNSSTTVLDSYIVTNIAVAYQIHKHIGLTARLENAFDENYEEASGYNTDDRTVYVGVSFK